MRCRKGVPGVVAGNKWGDPVGVPVAGRMGPGVDSQRHPQMDVRDAAGLGTSSMLWSGTMGTARVPVERARGAGMTWLPKIQEL